MAWLNDSFRLRGDDRIAYENRRGLFLAILIAVFAAGVGVSGPLLIVSALYNYVAFYAAVALMVCVSLLIFTHSTKEDIEFREAKDRRESEALAEREKALNGMDDEFNHVIMLQLSLKQLLDQLQEWFGKHEYYAAVFYGREAPSILAYADSKGNSSPASSVLRRRNANYYCEADYKVCRSLTAGVEKKSPIYIPVVEYDNLKFDDDDERQSFKSLILVAIADDYALAIACERETAFKKKLKPWFKEYLIDVVRQMACYIAIKRLDEHKEAKTVRTMLGDEYV